MSVRGKAAAVAAPEAAAARRILPGDSPAKVNAELQRRRREATERAQQRRQAKQQQAQPATQPDDGGQDGEQGGSSRPLSSRLAAPMNATQTGGGFVLGLMAWAVARAYLTGGADGVKQLLRAKFLNQTTKGGNR